MFLPRQVRDPPPNYAESEKQRMSVRIGDHTKAQLGMTYCEGRCKRR